MATIFVAGANGQTGRLIASQLAEAGHQVRGLIRDAGQGTHLEAAGVECCVGDLTGTFSHGLKDAEIVYCAAGAGVAGNPEEIDHLATVRLIEQCVLQKVQRFVLISSMGTTHVDQMPSMLKPFLEAKRKAEVILEESGLTYTIIRPGGLNNQPGTGLIQAAPLLHKSGVISRTDVARAAVLALTIPQTENKAFDLLEGDQPIADALSGL